MSAATMARVMERETALIRCACGQLIARRSGNHIEPIGAPLQLDGKGRPVLVCPSCGLFTVVKRTVKGDE